MSVRAKIAWLFDVGDECEVDAPNGASTQPRRPQRRPDEVVESPLYGEAEAIRVLYQTALVDETPRKPPRPRRGRRVWLGRFLQQLGAALVQPTGAKV
jgi:hypothetical protein